MAGLRLIGGVLLGALLLAAGRPGSAVPLSDSGPAPEFSLFFLPEPPATAAAPAPPSPTADLPQVQFDVRDTQLFGGDPGAMEALRQRIAAGLNRIEPAAGAAPRIAGAAGDPAGARGTSEAEDAPPPDDGVLRLRDVVRALTTVRGATDSATAALVFPEAAAAVRPSFAPSMDIGAGGSLLDLVLNIPVDSDLLNVLTKVITPAVEPGQFVSFSIAGLGRFVLLFSVDDRSLRMIDLDGSMSLKLSHSNDGAVSGPYGVYGTNPALAPARDISGPSLKEILANLRAEVLGFVTNPLTIIGAVIAVILWLIWRMRGSTA